jgi:hypothetical protein
MVLVTFSMEYCAGALIKSRLGGSGGVKHPAAAAPVRAGRAPHNPPVAAPAFCRSRYQPEFGDTTLTTAMVQHCNAPQVGAAVYHHEAGADVDPAKEKELALARLDATVTSYSLVRREIPTELMACAVVNKLFCVSAFTSVDVPACQKH